ncbi:MAG: hypothetical protein QXU32_06715 [Nitrososphaerales archaeon]
MARFIPARHMGERWNLGMLATPNVPCPVCGKVSRAKETCPWCDAHWDKNELKQREMFRRQIINSYSKNVKEKLRRLGYL